MTNFIKTSILPNCHVLRFWLKSRRPVGSTNQANPSCFYFRISWILIEWCCFYFFSLSWFSAGPQKPQILTALKTKPENFEPKIYETCIFDNYKYNFKTSWPPKISISKFVFISIITLNLMIKKRPLTFSNYKP